MMLDQVLFRGELLPTVYTVKILNNNSASCSVSLQIGFRQESFTTNITWKRFFFQMGVTVAIMMVTVHKTFSTNLTYERKALLMAFHMQLIIISRGELFSAVFLLTGYHYFCLK